ncbi:MAG: hypothetical protein H2069_10515 [Legionella sp.]|nr:hypothetical protein [Legionella sp.]
MFIEFNQDNICTFPAYVLAIRGFWEGITEEKTSSFYRQHNSLDNDDISILNEYAGRFKKARQENHRSADAMIPVFPICLIPTKEGLKYTSSNPDGEIQEGFISNEELGFKIDFKQSKENLTNFLQTKLPEILKITSNRGHTIPSHPNLLKYIFKFDGLCELISNYVIIEDLMGRKQNNLVDYNKNSYKMINIDDNKIKLSTNNVYQEKITLFNLNKPRIINSHVLEIYSFWQKLIAFLFNVYPCSLFSYKDRIKNTNNEVNQELLYSKLNSLTDGFYIKFMVFNKKLLSFEGHSMVIKKIGELFSFFDPNEGEQTDLTFANLCQIMNKSINKYHANNIALLDAKQFILKLDNSFAESPSLNHNL